MNIPSYQMHNVLSYYSKQLSQTRISENQKLTANKSWAGNDSIDLAGKRRATIERVSKEIYDRITQFSASEDAGHPDVSNISDQARQNKADTGPGKERETKFVFNEIDGINNKKTNMLSVEDASFLIERLEQLAKKAVDKKLESWI